MKQSLLRDLIGAERVAEGPCNAATGVSQPPSSCEELGEDVVKIGVLSTPSYIHG